LEACVTQNYLPFDILDICMNYFLWKGDLKRSAEFARMLRFWKNRGLNDELVPKKSFPFSFYVKEFEALEATDDMYIVLKNSVEKEIIHNNTHYLFTSIKSLYYKGYLKNILLIRIFYSSNLLIYNQIWEFGIRRLKDFTAFNPGIKQEWINVYFSTIDDYEIDEDLFNNILPVDPSVIERRNDKFMILGFHKDSCRLLKIVLFRQRGDRKFPLTIWRNDMLVN